MAANPPSHLLQILRCDLHRGAAVLSSARTAVPVAAQQRAQLEPGEGDMERPRAGDSREQAQQTEHSQHPGGARHAISAVA